MEVLSKMRNVTSQKQFFKMLTVIKPAFLQVSANWFSQKSNHTYYETLGLHQNASAKEIRDAFLKLSKQYHPDVTQNDLESHSRFLKIIEAYSVLSKPSTRREYNSSLVRESMRHENSQSNRSPDSYYSKMQQVPKRKALSKDDIIFQNVRFSDASWKKQDEADSIISEIVRYSVYSVVACFAIALFIMSNGDTHYDLSMKSPHSSNSVYMGKDELEKGKLLWRAEQSGTTVYYYAVDSESNGQKVYVASREYGPNGRDYFYRVLTTYNQPQKR
ncbi:hypothetical protein BsWGS_20777 [Bradybaena similaris]